jgi:hypothetical protein
LNWGTKFSKLCVNLTSIPQWDSGYLFDFFLLENLKFCYPSDTFLKTTWGGEGVEWRSQNMSGLFYNVLSIIQQSSFKCFDDKFSNLFERNELDRN